MIKSIEQYKVGKNLNKILTEVGVKKYHIYCSSVVTDIFLDMKKVDELLKSDYKFSLYISKLIMRDYKNRVQNSSLPLVIKTHLENTITAIHRNKLFKEDENEIKKAYRKGF